MIHYLCPNNFAVDLAGSAAFPFPKEAAGEVLPGKCPALLWIDAADRLLATEGCRHWLQQCRL
jgi:hypothetical protein